MAEVGSYPKWADLTLEQSHLTKDGELVFLQLLGGNVFVPVDLLLQGYRPALSLLPHPKPRMGLISVGLGVC